MKLSIKPTAKKMLKFGSGGLLTYSIKIVLTYLFTEFINLSYYISYLCTLVIILIFSFFYHVIITFQIKKILLSHFIKFNITSLFIYFIDAILVWSVTEILKIHYIYSISIITILLFFVKFILFDKLIFYVRQNE